MVEILTVGMSVGDGLDQWKDLLTVGDTVPWTRDLALYFWRKPAEHKQACFLLLTRDDT